MPSAVASLSGRARLTAAVLLFGWGMGVAMDGGLVPAPPCCTVLELRQYTLKPGRRDALVDLFDRQFVESQEEVGATIVGQFRDRRRPDRFVWIRGFADMTSRHAALERFYGGPVWAAHREAANATMLDVDDVLLLKPARPDTAFRVNPRERPEPGERRLSLLAVAGIHSLPRPADPAAVDRIEARARPALAARGIAVAAVFVTEPSPNTFTRLPVREGENVVVWFGTREPDDVAQGERGPEWLEALARDVSAAADPPVVLLDLEPTPRSLWGHPPRLHQPPL